MAVKSVQVIIKGTTYTLTLNSSTGNYEADVTAPRESSYNNNSGHYFPVTAKATDTAGNSTTVSDSDAALGSKLKLRVKETVAPAISITYPTEDQYLINNKPTINWTVTDSGSGVDPNTIGITIDSGNKITSGITTTAITNGYQCSYPIPTALTDGTHTVRSDAGDYDGNAATQRTVNFVIDTVPPSLSVTSPTNNLITNNSKVTVVGTTNDAISSPVSLTVKLNSGSAQTVTVAGNGAFSKELTVASGANTITIVAKDAAGKTTTVTRTVTLDTKAPIIGNVIISPNPVSTGEIIKVTVAVTD